MGVRHMLCPPLPFSACLYPPQTASTSPQLPPPPLRFFHLHSASSTSTLLLPPPLCFFHLHSASSTSTLLLLPPLHSNSDVYLHSSYDYIAPTLRLTTDQHWTHLDLVPMPRATVYIPLLHLSYLPDPFSLTIMGNYSFLV